MACVRLNIDLLRTATLRGMLALLRTFLLGLAAPLLLGVLLAIPWWLLVAYLLCIVVAAVLFPQQPRE